MCIRHREQKMSSGPSLYVPSAIASEAKQLIAKGAGDAVRQGVELLLKNDLKDVGANIAGSVDAGSDLQRGLAALANSPFDALGVDIGAGTVDIRKAYKKMALKYRKSFILLLYLTLRRGDNSYDLLTLTQCLLFTHTLPIIHFFRSG